MIDLFVCITLAINIFHCHHFHCHCQYLPVDSCINTLRPEEKGWYFVYDIFKCIVLNDIFLFWTKFHWNFFLRVQLIMGKNQATNHYLNQCSSQWHHNKCDGVSNHWRLVCLLNRLFRRRSKKISKLWVTGLCEGNPPVTSDFPSQRASNSENVSIWWRHHVIQIYDASVCY